MNLSPSIFRSPFLDLCDTTVSHLSIFLIPFKESFNMSISLGLGDYSPGWKIILPHEFDYILFSIINLA